MYIYTPIMVAIARNQCVIQPQEDDYYKKQESVRLNRLSDDRHLAAPRSK